MTDRDASWAALHDPETSAEQLAAIAARHPEFAGQISVHPQCYPELRAWAEAQQAAAGVTPPQQDMSATKEPEPLPAEPDSPTAKKPPRSRTALWITAAVAAGALALMGGGAWALLNAQPEPEVAADGEPSASPSSEASPAEPREFGDRRLAGPPVYVGDELDWLVLDESELTPFFPAMFNVERGNELYTIGEGEGAHTNIEACAPWLFPDVRPIVGVRSLEWASSSSESFSDGGYRVLQFPTVEMAASYFSDFSESLDACGRYEVLGWDEMPQSVVELSATARSEEGFALKERREFVYPGAESVDEFTMAKLVEGNVVIEVAARIVDGQGPDGEALLAAMSAQAEEARELLTAEIGYRP